MLIKRILGATRVLGKSQGYRGLPIRDEPVINKADGLPVNCMVSAWELTPDEIDRLKKGATIYLKVMGIAHPPVMLEIGEPENGYDFTEETCPNHVASASDSKICGRCGTHIDSLRPDDDDRIK